MFDFITYFTDCVPDFIKKPLSFVLFAPESVLSQMAADWKREAQLPVVFPLWEEPLLFLRTSRWKRAFSLFSRPRNHIR